GQFGLHLHQVRARGGHPALRLVEVLLRGIAGARNVAKSYDPELVLKGGLILTTSTLPQIMHLVGSVLASSRASQSRASANLAINSRIFMRLFAEKVVRNPPST